MKKIFLTLAFIALAFKGFGETWKNQELNDIIIPGAKTLDPETLGCGEKVKAFHIYFENVGPNIGGIIHYGLYIDAQIETIMTQPIHPLSPLQESNVGRQVVLYGAHPTQYSCSQQWKIKTVKDVKYIVHEHLQFDVYTNDQEQFVFGK